MPTFVPLHHNESHFIRFSFFCPIPSLFLFLSLYQRRRWVEEGRREVPSTVICNQGNGQSLSDCQTVAPTRESPMNTSLANFMVYTVHQIMLNTLYYQLTHTTLKT